MTAKQFGRLIRKIRIKQKITQPGLASTAKLPKSLLYEIETRGGNPSLVTLQKLATALRITINIRP